MVTERRRQPEVQGRRRRRGRRSGRRRRPVEEEGRRVRAVLLLPVGVGRGQLHHRAGQRAARRERPLHAGPRQRAPGRRLHPGAARRGPVHGRVAEAARLGGRLAGAVPRERRRQPRADGIEHAAPGGAAAARAQRRTWAPAWNTSPPATRARWSSRGAPAPSTTSTASASSCASKGRSDADDFSKEMGADIYPMTKFKRSNQNTCINQKPIVRVGQKVAKGQVLGRRPVHRARRAGARPQRARRVHAVARLQLRGRDPGLREDGEGGLLHLHPHRGVRDRGARHQARPRRDHARHPERRRRRYLRDLDDSGIIRIGAYVKPGDILVGKVTPKGETQLTPEEKLLRAIFGEKAGDVRDASLICPPGIEGIIVGVKIFSRKGIEKDDRAKAIEQEELDMMEKNLQDEIRILHDEVKKRVMQMLNNQTLRADAFDEYGRERLLKKGTVLTPDVLQEVPYEQMVRLKIAERRSAARRRPAAARGADRAAGRSDPPAVRGEEGEDPPRRRAAAGRDQAGQGLRRDEAQAVGRRQDGRPPRQQGRHRAHPARRGHAVSAGRDAGGDRAQSARRAVAHERRPDSRDASRVGGARARPLLRDAGVRRRAPRPRSRTGWSRPGCRRAARRSSTTA